MPRSCRSIHLLLLSDTHELHRSVEIPQRPDLVLFAGDLCMMSRSMAAVRDFNAWLDELGAPVVLIPGNHELFLEEDPAKRSMLNNAHVLVNESIEIKDLKIWGSPVSMFGGSFVLKSAAHRRSLYSQIPDGTDILLTHTPPYGRLDTVRGSDFHAGCFELREAVDRVKPKLHVFGHIHGAYGIEQTEDTVFVNACLLGPGGGIEYPPVMLKMSAQ